MARAARRVRVFTPCAPNGTGIPSLGVENDERFEFLVPSHKAALEPDIGKILGDPNMAFPFACCFTKLPVLANLRTAGFGRPQAAEGFEFRV